MAEDRLVMFEADDATREPKTVTIGVTKELNEGRNAKETVEKENAGVGVYIASGSVMVLDETAQTPNADIRAIKNFQNNEVKAIDAKKPMLVANVVKVIETAELGKDAASETIMVLDEATPTAVEDISIDNAEEQDFAAQVATKDLNETTESCDDASTPKMEKAEAEEPKEATPTAAVEIAAPTYQSTEVTADENAEEPEDTPEDKTVNGGGVHDVLGERD